MRRAHVGAAEQVGLIADVYDMPGIETRAGIATTGGAKSAWFKDSEGNIMAIVQTT